MVADKQKWWAVLNTPINVRVPFVNKKRKKIPVTGLEWPRGFQEVNFPIFHDNGRGWW